MQVHIFHDLGIQTIDCFNEQQARHIIQCDLHDDDVNRIVCAEIAFDQTVDNRRMNRCGN